MKIKSYCIGMCCFLLANSLHAQDTIPPKTIADDITITAFRFPENIKKVPFQTLKISNKNWNMLVANTADILTNSGGVFVQKSQAGGGSPVIRGFEASRVLLQVDGVRMNNAIYRAGHLQNIVTVDANILKNMDILYGPASTQFGSDALGGVVSMFTKNPELTETKKNSLSGNIGSSFASAVNMFQLHADLNFGFKKWAILTSFTSTDPGDLLQGKQRKSKYPDFGKKLFYVNSSGGGDFVVPNKNPNKQIASAYRQYDFLQKIKFVPKEGREHILNLQFSTTSDVPRYDRLTETVAGLPRFAEWYYGPQKRILLAHQFNANYKKGFLHKLQSILAFQQIEESRFDRRFNNKSLNNRIENLQAISYTLDGLYKKGEHETHAGIDFQLNYLQSTAFSKNIITGAQANNINTRYPDGNNRMYYVAAYFQHLYAKNNNTQINFGLRYTQTALSSTFIDRSIMNFPFSEAKQSNGAFSGNLGIIYNTGNFWKLSALISTGFRAPNIDDLGKVFDSRAGSVVVPNTGLKPEYTYNGEINATKYAGPIQFGGSIFYTIFRNAIVVDDFTFNGQTSIVYQGVNSMVLANQNKNKAVLYGASSYIKFTLALKTTIEATATTTTGKIQSATKTPLDHIPPFFGRFGIKHQEKKWNTEIYTLFNGWKKLKDYSNSGEDNLQYATADGMPAWSTMNWRASYFMAPKMQVFFGIENLLDLNYRTFASGISAPGRNFVASLKAGF